MSTFPPPEPIFQPHFSAHSAKIFATGVRPEERVERAREQLEGVVSVLKQHGIVVHRPCMDYDFSAPASTPDWSVPRQYGASCPRDPVLINGHELLEATMSYRSRYHEYLSYQPLFSRLAAADPQASWLAAPKPRLLDSLYTAGYPSCVGPEAVDDPLYPLVSRRKFKTNETEAIWDAADVVRFGRDLFVMHGLTTNQLGYECLRDHFAKRGIRTHQIHFTNDTCPMHIDVNLAPLDRSTCLFNQEHGTPEWFKDLLRDNGWNLIEAVPSDEPLTDFATSGMWLSVNVFSIDPKRILVDTKAISMQNLLAKHGFEPIPVEIDHMNEFGGGLHCVTLDTEKASWSPTSRCLMRWRPVARTRSSHPTGRGCIRATTPQVLRSVWIRTQCCRAKHSAGSLPSTWRATTAAS